MLLIRKPQVAATLSVSLRTIDHYAKWHETNRLNSGNGVLPSSPRNGLYSIRLLGGHRRFDERDLLEYIENSTNEALGLPLENWRAKPKKKTAAGKAGAPSMHL